jgi:CheY-like chemotaxis protein
MIEQVTEPFFTTKDVGKGTGLGLSMVYGFARQSGGGIAIHSTVGEGTRVEILLPRATSEPADADRGRGAPAECRSAEARNLRVLLVDDHDAVRETTAALLSDMGHAVVAAPDGPSMLKLLEASPGSYDFIVTDYAMPLMSGSEMLRIAREIRPALPGIIISGNTDEQSLDTMRSDIVISKPFTAAEMREAIDVALTRAGEPAAASART